MKLTLCIVAFLLVFAYAQTDMDLVLDMLNDLRTQAHSSLLELDEQWNQSQQQREDTIAALKETKDQQVKECKRRDELVKNKQIDIWRTTDFIAWIQQRIVANNQRIKILEDLRCDQAQNFIDTVKDNKIELTVANFLKNQIQKIVEENSSFFQKRDAMKQISTFLEKIATSTYDILNMQRDAEVEIDEKLTQLLEVHSKEQMTPLEFQKFKEEKNEILASLNDIEEHVVSNIPLSQNNMIRAGLAFMHFKEQIGYEQQIFDQHLVEQADKLKNYQDQVITMQKQLKQCKFRVEEITLSIELAQQNLDQAMQSYLSTHQRLIEELNFFVEVANFYQGEVHEQSSEEFKKEVQEKIDATSEIELNKITVSRGELENKKSKVIEKRESYTSIIDPKHESSSEVSSPKEPAKNEIVKEIEQQEELMRDAPPQSEFADADGEVSADFILAEVRKSYADQIIL